jgi:SAM-dependent methyltransferase
VVYSFHVLEHLTDNIISFIENCLKCLKPGGKFIISVPNNEGFSPKYSVLNYPPHHMGLWGNTSLNYLTKLFPIEEVKTLYSPLTADQIPDFNIYAAKEIGKKPFLIRSLSRFPFTYRYFFNENKRAYTIMKVFRKQ